MSPSLKTVGGINGSSSSGGVIGSSPESPESLESVESVVVSVTVSLSEDVYSAFIIPVSSDTDSKKAITFLKCFFIESDLLTYDLILALDHNFRTA